jgi:hypothetical protein
MPPEPDVLLEPDTPDVLLEPALSAEMSELVRPAVSLEPDWGSD